LNQTLIKTTTGWVPENESAKRFHTKCKLGGTAHGKFTELRNPGFHRKYFALLNIAFENWDPGVVDTKWGAPVKNFDEFRKNIAILCGYRELVFKMDGSYRMVAKSISFSGMEQEEFEGLYQATITVLLKNVYGSDMSREKLDNIVNEYLSFA